MNKPSYITVPKGVKYLSEVPELSEGLPENCLFNKVLTGAGGTYVALTSKNPYVIAVPTKALVEDKIRSSRYAHVKLLAVSGDYNFTNHEGASFGYVPEGYDKIICTYQQLEKVSSRIDTRTWNLLVDEMHLILRMVTFCGESLRYLIEHFRDFKSYCFMSATIPKNEHLIQEVRDLPRVEVLWEDVTPVGFCGLYSPSVRDSLLQIAEEHLNGTRPGNAYFFYNTVAGICSVLSKLKRDPTAKANTVIVAAKSPLTVDRFSKEGFKVSGASDPHGVVNFVTSAAFEGADFMDPEGVTYIVTEDKYEHTKYSIVTTIPQIVGRLRESRFKDKVYILYDKSTLLDARTFSEVMDVIEDKEAKAKTRVKAFEYTKGLDSNEDALKDLIRGASTSIYNNILGMDTTIEELEYAGTLEKDLSQVDLTFNEYARFVDLEYYDTLTNHHLLVGNKTFIKSFSSQTSKSVSGILDNSELAPQLSMATKKKYKTAKIGVKAFVELYNENKLLAKEEDYELYEALEDLGEAVFKKCSYYRARIKTAHENFKKSSKYAPKAKLLYHFQVGSSMTDERIKKELSQRFGITKNHIAWLSKYFELKRTSIRGASARRILRYVGQ